MRRLMPLLPVRLQLRGPMNGMLTSVLLNALGLCWEGKSPELAVPLSPHPSRLSAR